MPCLVCVILLILALFMLLLQKNSADLYLFCGFTMFFSCAIQELWALKTEPILHLCICVYLQYHFDLQLQSSRYPDSNL